MKRTMASFHGPQYFEVSKSARSCSLCVSPCPLTGSISFGNHSQLYCCTKINTLAPMVLRICGFKVAVAVPSHSTQCVHGWSHNHCELSMSHIGWSTAAVKCLYLCPASSSCINRLIVYDFVSDGSVTCLFPSPRPVLHTATSVCIYRHL